jgi:hypothetical protein
MMEVIICPLGKSTPCTVSVDLRADVQEYHRIMGRLAHSHSCTQVAPSFMATPLAHHLRSRLDRFRILLVSLPQSVIHNG